MEITFNNYWLEIDKKEYNFYLFALGWSIYCKTFEIIICNLSLSISFKN